MTNNASHPNEESSPPVSSTNFERVRMVFLEASELADEQQESFVRTACDHDPALINQVMQLLGKKGADIEIGPVDFIIGKVVGQYEVIERIGSGGMGSVYRARRNDPEKDVALKVINDSIRRSRESLWRFQKERQTLAHLEHPNICRLLDGGATDEGLPYFVMDFIDGVDIRTHVADQHLSIREILKLFQQVLDAVAYVHEREIIHRDIKPGNIMVTEDGKPMLLDFGIAKIVDNAGLDTISEHQPKTLAYAAPEQLANEQVTTKSDIYSLGVVLYELLTGMRPFQQHEGNVVNHHKHLIEDDPIMPSMMLSKSDTSHQYVDVPQARRTLRGELDWIVTKAIQKDPADRYPTVRDFSEDLQRYFDNEPIVAGPQKFGYRAKKFVRRNHAKVGLPVAIGLALMFFTLWQSREIALAERTKRENAERRIAELRQKALRSDNEYLRREYEASEELNRQIAAERDIARTERERAEAATQEKDEVIRKLDEKTTELEGKNQALVASEKALNVAITEKDSLLQEEKRLSSDLEKQRRLIEVKNRELKEKNSELTQTESELTKANSTILSANSKLAEKRRQLEDVLNNTRANNTRLDTMKRLIEGLLVLPRARDEGKLSQLIDSLESGVARLRPQLDEDPGLQVYLDNFLTRIYLELREFEEAKACAERAYSAAQKHLSPTDAEAIGAACGKAEILWESGKYDEAEELAEELYQLLQDSELDELNPERLRAEFLHALKLIRPNPEDDADFDDIGDWFDDVDMDDVRECFAILGSVLERCRIVYGPRHEETIKVATWHVCIKSFVRIKSLFDNNAALLIREGVSGLPLMELQNLRNIAADVYGESHKLTIYLNLGQAVAMVFDDLVQRAPIEEFEDGDDFGDWVQEQLMGMIYESIDPSPRILDAADIVQSSIYSQHSKEGWQVHFIVAQMFHGGFLALKGHMLPGILAGIDLPEDPSVNVKAERWGEDVIVVSLIGYFATRFGPGGDSMPRGIQKFGLRWCRAGVKMSDERLGEWHQFRIFSRLIHAAALEASNQVSGQEEVLRESIAIANSHSSVRFRYLAREGLVHFFVDHEMVERAVIELRDAAELMVSSGKSVAMVERLEDLMRNAQFDFDYENDKKDKMESGELDDDGLTYSYDRNQLEKSERRLKIYERVLTEIESNQPATKEVAQIGKMQLIEPEADRLVANTAGN